MRVDDVDLFEINEAFASVVLAWQRETGVDPEPVSRGREGACRRCARARDRPMSP